MAWLFRRRQSSADVSRLTDLLEVRSIRLQHRFYAPIAIIVGLVLPMLIAWTWGDPIGGLLVAGFLRTVVMLQTTFCVNSVAPAVVRTKILEQLTEAQISYMTEKIPMRRTGEPWEIAAVVHFLSSPDCSFVTAQCYDASGGRATY